MLKQIFLLGCFLLSSAFLIGISKSEVVNYRLCNSTGSERNVTSTVHGVTVTPCAQAPDGPCDVVAGQNATVTVDFTPRVKMGKRSRHGIYWAKAVDMQLKGMPKSACKGNFVNCTLAANVKRTYTAVIPLKPSFPKKMYDVKVKVYDGRKVHFCVLVQVKLV